MSLLLESEGPLRALRITHSPAGSQSAVRAALRHGQHAGHPNKLKCWAAEIKSDGWATSEGFEQDTAPSLAQAAKCWPKWGFAPQLWPPKPSFGLDVSWVRKSLWWWPHQPATGVLSWELPRRWWSPLLLSIHPFQDTILWWLLLHPPSSSLL